jgi:heme-degrading monooxygenase HmoA
MKIFHPALKTSRSTSATDFPTIPITLLLKLSGVGDACGERMIVVLFESKPAAGKVSTYLSMGEALNGHLATVDGFLAIERFEHVKEAGRLIAISYWRDRESVDRWRQTELHRRIQADSRNNVFENYRLIVADVLRDYGKFNRDQAPADSRIAIA